MRANTTKLGRDGGIRWGWGAVLFGCLLCGCSEQAERVNLHLNNRDGRVLDSVVIYSSGYGSSNDGPIGPGSNFAYFGFALGKPGEVGQVVWKFHEHAQEFRTNFTVPAEIKGAPRRSHLDMTFSNNVSEITFRQASR